jgi:hypothetical protein
LPSRITSRLSAASATPWPTRSAIS